MKRKEIRWLRRHPGHAGPFLALCLSKKAFHAALRNLDLPEMPRFMSSDTANATTHYFNRPSDGELMAIVCVKLKRRNKLELYALLVHEAVHVWQVWCKDIGETHPGDEHEAYCIQSFSLLLMDAYRSMTA